MTDTDESSGRDIHTTDTYHQSILSDFKEFRRLCNYFTELRKYFNQRLKEKEPKLEQKTL